ncbi:helix-turn-helix transcriptional regulator [Bacillus massiliglaciei]|uniref:helix-turn-helix transcriptional regulator n=1 Tax=Bacillus massiliglaciei TaxID=1816693 RepID=UPI000DA63948|nr:helix-turn-helix transcriptional regulator [Bacillus massiliglaciei]
MKINPKIEEIHRALIRKGFTKRALAKVAEIGEVTAIQVCNGNRKPSPPIAKKIVDALEVEFDDIFEIEASV